MINNGNISTTGVDQAVGIDVGSVGIVTNLGTISANGATTIGSTGISLRGPAMVINYGTISGTGGPNFPVIASAGDGYGIVSTATEQNQIINYGIILGTGGRGSDGSVGMGIGIQTNGDVTNFGTITGTTLAIEFLATGNTRNTLTLGPTSIINGNVVALGVNNILQLSDHELGASPTSALTALSGVGSFDVGLIGPTAQYQGFNTFNVVSGTWTVFNTFGQSQAWNVNGGTLAGTATLKSVNVNDGGTLSPGTGPGTAMTILGNLALQSGAIYLVQLNSTTASSANVTGTASLGGTVRAVFAAGNVAKSYDILHTTGGLGGSFAKLETTNLPPGFRASLGYTATDVLLNLTAALGGSQQATGLSQNHQSVASAINAHFNNGGTLPPSFHPLFGLTGGNLANALKLPSGEAATGAQQSAFQLMNEFMGLMLDPFVDGRAGIGGVYGPASPFAPEREPLPEDIALAYAKVLRTPVYKTALFEPRWSIWGGAYGGYNKTGGDPLVVGSHDLTARTAGVAAGLDYQVAPGTVVGFALAGGGTGWSLAQNLGSGRSDAFQAGVYGTTRSGPAYLAAALAYTEHWMSTDRIAFAGDHPTADFNAHSFGGRIEAGYRIPVAFWGLTPYAAVQAQNFHTPAYSETNVSGGGFGLTYNARTATDTRSELGARFDKQILLNWNAVLALRGRVAWAHDWVTDPSLIPTFEALPGASFIVNGATPAKNSALASAGAELRLNNGVSVLAKFDGEFANRSQTYAGTGTVRYTW